MSEQRQSQPHAVVEETEGIPLKRRNTISFVSPDELLVPEMGDTQTAEDRKRRLSSLIHPGRSSDLNLTKETTAPKSVKPLLPRPYKLHWEEIERRRATRDFIYGRDEEYVFSEQDSRVKTPCSGVLCFHTIELLDLVVDTKSFADNIPVSYYCLLSIGAVKRITKIVHALYSYQIKMDTHVHLSVEVSEWREAPNNRLLLELWSFQDPEAHFIIGTAEIHIYNFIRLQHSIDTVRLYSDGIKVGILAYEASFSYGAFGYGHSNQLKNFSQPLMETISHSMFPRIRLDEGADLADSAFQARKPESLKMFTYHSLILEVDEKDLIFSYYGDRKAKPRSNHNSSHIDLEPKPMVVQQVDFHQGFPVHCKLQMNIWQKIMQPDFNDMYGEYVCLGHKRERLEYLTSMVQGRMSDLYEEEAGTMFQFLKSREIECINKLSHQIHSPGEILYPRKIPCPSSQPYTLQQEDEAFQEKFPPIRRETGYLSPLFGYEKKVPASEQLNDMDYPAFKHARVPPPKTVTAKSFRTWIWNWLMRKIIIMKMAAVRTYHYAFPDVEDELVIPEISVTSPTPEGSTSDIYSYFMREENKDQGYSGSKVDRLVKQTTALIDMTTSTYKRKTKKLGVSDSSSSGDDSN